MQKKQIRFYSRKWCLLTIVFISCCPLLSQAGTPSELKDIHMSSPDVNMNYIKSVMFLNVCIEIVTVKQSALSLFVFMCVHVSIFLCAFFFLFLGVWFIVTVVQFVACTFVMCLIKINRSISQSYVLFAVRQHVAMQPLATSSGVI